MAIIKKGGRNPWKRNPLEEKNPSGEKWAEGPISKSLKRCEECSKRGYKEQREKPCTHIGKEVA